MEDAVLMAARHQAAVERPPATATLAKIRPSTAETETWAVAQQAVAVPLCSASQVHCPQPSAAAVVLVSAAAWPEVHQKHQSVLAENAPGVEQPLQGRGQAPARRYPHQTNEGLRRSETGRGLQLQKLAAVGSADLALAWTAVGSPQPSKRL